MKLLALTLMTLFCAGLTSVTAQNTTTGGNEYCMWERFNATCTGAGETIAIRSARYGRMKVGRCLPDNYMIGCVANVSDIVGRRCNGQTSCAFALPDRELHTYNQCRRDLVAYLEVDYRCTVTARVDEKLNRTMVERVEKLEADNKKLMSVLDDFKSQGYVRRCRICFNEAEGSSQCQGVRRSCSEWSSTRNGRWTEPFRDVTDYRPGGCVYQWRVECQ